MDTNIVQLKEYFTVDEIESGVAGVLPISKRTQARYRKEGLLPYIKSFSTPKSILSTFSKCRKIVGD